MDCPRLFVALATTLSVLTGQTLSAQLDSSSRYYADAAGALLNYCPVQPDGAAADSPTDPINLLNLLSLNSDRQGPARSQSLAIRHQNDDQRAKSLKPEDGPSDPARQAESKLQAVRGGPYLIIWLPNEADSQNICPLAQARAAQPLNAIDESTANSPTADSKLREVRHLVQSFIQNWRRKACEWHWLNGNQPESQTQESERSSPSKIAASETLDHTAPLPPQPSIDPSSNDEASISDNSNSGIWMSQLADILQQPYIDHLKRHLTKRLDEEADPYWTYYELEYDRDPYWAYYEDVDLWGIVMDVKLNRQPSFRPLTEQQLEKRYSTKPSVPPVFQPASAVTERAEGLGGQPDRDANAAPRTAAGNLAAGNLEERTATATRRFGVWLEDFGQEISRFGRSLQAVAE